MVVADEMEDPVYEEKGQFRPDVAAAGLSGAVSAEMTTSPRQSGVSSAKRPSVMGKARTSVGPLTPR